MTSPNLNHRLSANRARKSGNRLLVTPHEGQFLTPTEDTEYAGRILGFLNRHFGH